MAAVRQHGAATGVGCDVWFICPQVSEEAAQALSTAHTMGAKNERTKMAAVALIFGCYYTSVC